MCATRNFNMILSFREVNCKAFYNIIDMFIFFFMLFKVLGHYLS